MWLLNLGDQLLLALHPTQQQQIPHLQLKQKKTFQNGKRQCSKEERKIKNEKKKSRKLEILVSYQVLHYIPHT